MDLIPYLFVPRILFLVLYTLDLPPKCLLFENSAVGVGIFNFCILVAVGN